ncbi:MAG: DUF4974 domain-containing protein [Cyclobacteriaceae bacterium]|nr:DUF4974 domain-containing protein [Cyclobacteriaceae bacterium]
MEFNDKIISDYLNGELSPKDQLAFDRWLSENQSNKELIEKMEKVWQTSFPYPSIVNMHDEQNKLWARLHVVEKPSGSQTIPLWNTALKIAATIIIVLGLGFIYHNYLQPRQIETIALATTERNNPPGQKSKIQLPDGSTIWLNAGSTISYTNDYNKKDRKLIMEGEAYFEVAKNPAMPFEVFTNHLVITAIGTSFNVNTFDEAIQKIALNTGKVKIVCLDSISQECEPSYLQPGTLAVYDEETKKIKMEDFEGMDLFGWKEGRIVFNHATMPEVVAVLERWYNVEIETVGTPGTAWDYTTTFDDEILENVLISLKFSENIDYELKGSNVILKLH